MEKLIANRLRWYLETNNILNWYQAGFRNTFSTNDPVIRLKTEAEHAIKSGSVAIAILLDFSRAFDLMWVDGMLLKLMQYGVAGNMLRWIKEFLTNRTYQVIIEETKSEKYSTDNGTPQGSTISPLLFLVMINDFPKLSTHTSQALFADDCTIWRAGNNILQITNHLQNDLKTIEIWAKKWGFNISTEKTVGIMFTRKTALLKPNVELNGRKITFNNTCKFLGVVFDSQLTWRPHIEYICDRVKPRLNLMRCITGINWGASKSILLTIYKALILSIIDYCSFVYEDSAASNLRRLDTLQYKSLLIVTGGMRGTSLKALLAECGELPLRLRRKEILTKYLIKLDNNNKNPTKNILSNIKYHQIEYVGKSIYCHILDDFYKQSGISINKDEREKNSDPPWSKFNPIVDLSLLDMGQELDKKVIKNKPPDNISKTQDDQTLIFTDGAVTLKGKVGAAVYIPSIPLELLFSLPKGMSVYFSEAYAILQALIYINQSGINGKIIVISDASKVLSDIKYCNYNKSPHPNMLCQICKEIKKLSNTKTLALTWMPGHINNIQSDKADTLAKQAADISDVQQIQYSMHEAVNAVDVWIWELWVKEWQTHVDCTYQKVFSLRKDGFMFRKQNRRRETTMSRLRLLQNQLNGYLHKIGLHATGNCNTCGVQQDINHFVFHCDDTSDLRIKLYKVVPNVRDRNIKFILNNHSSLHTVCDYIMEKKVKI